VSTALPADEVAACLTAAYPGKMLEARSVGFSNESAALLPQPIEPLYGLECQIHLIIQTKD
jgi:hypothetical protein